MADPINLNKFRKAKAKADKTQQAQENRAKFGRTKTEKSLEQARADIGAHAVRGQGPPRGRGASPRRRSRGSWLTRRYQPAPDLQCPS